MEIKFKVGDWVRATVGDAVVSAGGIGRVTDNSRTPYVDWIGKRRWSYIQDELEPWKPRVGERVRFTDECPEYWWFGPRNEVKDGTVYSVGLGKCNFTISAGADYVFVELKHIEPAFASSVGIGTITAEPQPPKFKAGDTVVYTAECGGYYTKGKTYEITGETKCFYQLTDDCGNTQHNWTKNEIGNHFVIAPIATTPTTAIVCLITNGQPLPSDKPVVHTSTSAATAEAMRLASVHTGQEFGVFVLASTAKVEKSYDHKWQQLAATGQKIAAIKELRHVTGMLLKSARIAVDDFLDAA